MKNQNGCTFSWLYQHYLAWFSDHAGPNAKPKSEEEVAGAHFYNEDVFEDGRILLSRMVYYVPLTAAETKSGHPELFGFTELNLMETTCSGDIEEITVVEYALL